MLWPNIHGEDKMNFKRRSHLHPERKEAENIKIKARGYDIDHGKRLEGGPLK